MHALLTLRGCYKKSQIIQKICIILIIKFWLCFSLNTGPSIKKSEQRRSSNCERRAKCYKWWPFQRELTKTTVRKLPKIVMHLTDSCDFQAGSSLIFYQHTFYCFSISCNVFTFVLLLQQERHSFMVNILRNRTTSNQHLVTHYCQMLPENAMTGNLFT